MIAAFFVAFVFTAGVLSSVDRVDASDHGAYSVVAGLSIVITVYLGIAAFA